MLCFDSWGYPSWISTLSGNARDNSHHTNCPCSSNGRRKCKELYDTWHNNFGSNGIVFLCPFINYNPIKWFHQEEKARVIQTLLFVAGINTLLQTLFGTRLPAVISASYTFVAPTLSIILSGRWSDPDPISVCDLDHSNTFLYCMHVKT